MYKIHIGTRICPLFPSGAGKTTLVKLLVGLYPPMKGHVKYNAIDSSKIDLLDLRKQLGFVTQDAQLFSGTIRENLLFVKLEPLLNNLEEITVIEYKNINAVALGIVPAGQKTYTPAERKLYTATGGGNRYGLSTAVSLDGIINGISGRTKMLKKKVSNKSLDTFIAITK